MISATEPITDRIELIAFRVGYVAQSCADRLISVPEVERGGWRVSEGVPGDWAAVARVISDRVRELDWRQRELAERPRASPAVVREIQRHTVERRRSPRTLESLSVALGWELGRLGQVLNGHAHQMKASSHTAADSGALWARLDSLQERLDEIAKHVGALRADLVILVEHVRLDG